jgi:hypothetical protein
MPFMQPTDSTTRRRRVFIYGATGSGKTHAFRTFPGPRYVLICPGEKGQDTLLKGDGSPADADTIVRVWENADEDGKAVDWMEKVSDEQYQALTQPRDGR